MRLTGLFFLFFISIALAGALQGEVCGWLGNNYIRVTREQNGRVTNYTLTTGLCGKKGWGGLAFSQFGSIQNATLTLVAFIEVGATAQGTEVPKVKTLSVHGHPVIHKITDVTHILDTSIITSVYTLFDILEFSLVIPEKMFNISTSEYVHFACFYGNPPRLLNGQWTGIEQHSTVMSYKISNFKADLNSCDLVAHMMPKLADTEVSIYIIEAIIFFLSIPLWFVLRKYEPLKSRSIAPVVCVCFLFGVTMTSSIIHLTDLRQNTRYQCALYSTIVMPAALILPTLMCLNFFRYVLIVNINKSKEQVNDGAVPLNIRLIKMLKIASSNFSALVILTVVYVLILVYETVMGSIWLFYCTADFYITASVPLYLSAVPMAFILLLMIFDTLSNFGQFIRCKLKLIFIKNDPLRFRFEQLFGLLSSGFVIPVAVFLGIFTPIMAKRDFTLLNRVTQSVYQAQAILTSLLIYTFYMYLYGFATTITIFNLLKGWICVRGKRPYEELNRLFRDKGLTQIFLDYAKTEWSIENVLAYKSIEEYKAKPSVDMANELWGTYFNAMDSLLEVNVPRNLCLDLKRMIDQKIVTKNSFDAIQHIVRINLCDTYSRFIMSPEYQIWTTNDLFQKDYMTNNTSMMKISSSKKKPIE